MNNCKTNFVVAFINIFGNIEAKSAQKGYKNKKHML